MMRENRTNRTFAPPNLHMRDRHYPTYTCELDGMRCHDVTLMCENRTLALSHYPTQDAIGFCFDLPNQNKILWHLQIYPPDKPKIAMATAGAGRGISRSLRGCAGILENRPTILHNRVAPQQKNFNAKFFHCYQKV